MLAIISDIHDNLPNLKKALSYCKNNNITTLACCGDISDGETLEYLAKNFPHTIYVTLGNMEIFTDQDLKKYPNIISFGKEGGAFKYKNKNIGICHEPRKIDNLAKKDNPDIIFYGHTHIPWEEKREVEIGDNKEKKIFHIVNPGNVSNTRHQPTFATYDPDNNNPKNNSENNNSENNLQLHLLNEMK